MPLYAVALLVFTLANVGLPGTSGFVGEFLALQGAFRANPWVAFFATTGVILSAPYMLWLYSRVMYGPLEKPALKGIADLDRREIALLAPLVVLVIWYGVLPGPVLDSFAASTDALVKGYQAALSATKTAALTALGLACHEPGACHPGLRPGRAGDHPRRRRARARPGRRLPRRGLDPARQPPGAGPPCRRARRRAGAAGRARHDLQRRLRRRPVREVHEGPDAPRLRRRDRHVGGLSAPRGHRPLRVPASSSCSRRSACW